MKKTVILAIFLAYIASILIVQFFGLKVVEMKGTVYITNIEVSGFEFTNRDDIQDAKYHKVIQLKDTSGKLQDQYAGYFVPGEYDKTPDNLKNNPNRVKILYKIVPYNASNQQITFDYDTTTLDEIIYFDEETYEFVFLKPRSISVVLTSRDGSVVRTQIGISLVL